MQMLVVAMLVVAMAGCTSSALTVTPNSQIGVLPISPEGVWHDLEVIAQHPVRKPVHSLFTRRHLYVVATGNEPGNMPREIEEYRIWLGNLDREIEAQQAAVNDYGEHVRDVLRRLLRRGTTQTYPPEYPQPDLQRNEVYLPEGPNRSILVVEYWPGATGVGTASYIEVELVQEYEEWRIDRLTPDPFAIPAGGPFNAILEAIPQTGRRTRPRE